MNPLPPEALVVRRAGLAITALVLFVVLAALDVLLRLSIDDGPSWPPLLPAIGVALVVGSLGWWWSARQHRAWGYRLDADRLRVERGVVVQRVSLVPRNRVQHVSTERGPLQRWLGLTTVTVHTAGAATPNVTIPYLEVDVGEELRRHLVEGR